MNAYAKKYPEVPIEEGVLAALEGRRASVEVDASGEKFLVTCPHCAFVWLWGCTYWKGMGARRFLCYCKTTLVVTFE